MFRSSGLPPFNPDRVLANVPKPPAKPTHPTSNDVGSFTLDKILQMASTPITPVTARDLMSFQSLVQQDANEPSKTNKRALMKHLEKIVIAAKASFADKQCRIWRSSCKSDHASSDSCRASRNGYTEVT